MKLSHVTYTKVEFNEKANITIPPENVKDAVRPDATLTFHTLGGDQPMKVRIVGFKIRKDKKISLTVEAVT